MHDPFDDLPPLPSPPPKPLPDRRVVPGIDFQFWALPDQEEGRDSPYPQLWAHSTEEPPLPPGYTQHGSWSSMYRDREWPKIRMIS